MTDLGAGPPYNVRFVPPEDTGIQAGTYGGNGTYGGPEQTYGQEAGETSFGSGLDFALFPIGGRSPDRPDFGWSTAAGGTVEFHIGERDDPKTRLGDTDVVTKELLLVGISYGTIDLVYKRDLTCVNEEWSATFAPDEVVQGRYRVGCSLFYASGRSVELPVSDELTAVVTA